MPSQHPRAPRTTNPQHPVGNLLRDASCFRGHKPRLGVTIIEVLFAILITTVGLFGAIAVFPFASAQARRSRIYDMLAVASRSAVHDFDARGMRRPEMWIGWYDGDATVSAGFKPALSIPAESIPVSGTTSAPVVGQSFCLDPRTIAAHTRYNAANVPFLDANLNANGGSGGWCVQNFPYATVGTPRVVGTLRRITLRQTANSSLLPSYNFPMSLAQANAIFKIDDDLSYNRPTDDLAAPAVQNVVGVDPNLPISSTNSWGRRQTDGNISWIATLVPKFDISGLPSDEYVLSIVMFHERPNDLDNVVDATGAANPRERVVSGVWQDPSAATGGEIRLTWPTSSPEVKLRPNDWVLVSGGSFINPTMYPPLGGFVFRHQWYRVADCDAGPSQEISTSGTSTANQELYATLMGQDWNTSFSSSPTSPPGAGAPIPVNVTILQGAFAVFEKTIRLDYGSTY